MKLKPVSWAVACALCAPAAWAAESGDQALPEMTVSQSRPTVAVDNPSPQAGVTQEEIRQINVINVEDALKYAPSLQIRKRYIGDRNSIIAARTTGTTQSARALVYADGLLLSNLLGNSFGFPPRWNMVGAEEIESIDVLYGPFSALLPGNSAGATVLMTTRRPEKFEAHARAQVFSQDYKHYGTDSTFDGHQEQATLGGRVGSLTWSLFANHIDSYGQPMSFAVNPTASPGAGGTTVTGYHVDTDPKDKRRLIFGATSLDHTVQDVAKVRVAYDFSPDTRAAFTYAMWRNDSFSDTQTYLRDTTNGASVWQGALNGGKRYIKIDNSRYELSSTAFAPTDRNEENSLTGLTLDSRLAPDWRLELAASDYDTLTDITRTPTEAPAGGQPGSAGGKGNITFADGSGWRNFDAKVVWKPAQGKAGHAATFGYHWDEYRIRSRQLSAANWRSDESTTTTNNRFAGNTSTEALFAQDVWKFDPRWTATVGLRHERWQAFDGSRYSSTVFKAPNGNDVNSYAYPSREENFNSPKLSLAWQATNEWTLRASLARAYRMPTVSELFQTETRSGVSGTFISDPNLKPEKILAKDLTAEGSVLGGNLRLSLFEEHVDDALYSLTNVSVSPNITKTQNIDRVRVRGAEAAYQAINVLLRGLDLSGSITYANSEILANSAYPASVGKWLPRVPDWRLSAFATYRVDEHWTTSVGLKYSGTQYNELDNSDVSQDKYGANSQFTTVDARVGYRFNKLMRAAVGVDNLTNTKAYAFHPYPQRVYHAELRLDY